MLPPWQLRMAGALNTTGRLLYFYGLGIALSSNNNNHDECVCHHPSPSCRKDREHFSQTSHTMSPLAS